MHENILEFVFQVSTLFIFLLGISLFIVINTETSAAIKATKENVRNEVLVYDGNYQVASDVTYDGYEIVSKIYQGLDYDIMINSKLINKDDDIEVIDFTIIDYSKSYNYNLVLSSDGEIVYVHYY